MAAQKAQLLGAVGGQTPQLKISEAASGRFFVAPARESRPLLNIPHVLNAQQFTPNQLERLFLRADELRKMLAIPTSRRSLASRYKGHQLCSLFYEPSTRTRLSFEQAATKLGVGIVSTENAREFSSAAKGETIEDSTRVINEYDFSIIVLRHHETGSALRAASVSNVPIINAGDGMGEHPTQALLDAYTIKREKGRLDRLHVVMGGDLRHGRTVRSLAQLLSKYTKNHISFVSMPGLKMQDDVLKILRAQGTTFKEFFSMEDARSIALRDADVVYWTRTQTERLAESEKDLFAQNTKLSSPNHKSTQASVSSFVIDLKVARLMKKDTIIMHPLPRVWEITPEVDNDPRAKYFEQAGNGLYIRMALLDTLLSRRMHL